MRRLLNRRSSVWETATAGAECWRAGIVLPISGKCTAVFGWILPRNTTGQLQMPVRKIELAGRRCSEKKQILKVLEPGTLLYFPGHVMMYLGYENGNFYVINDVSRLVKEGETMPVRVRSVIVNTLAVRRPNLRTWMEELTLALIPWET